MLNPLRYVCFLMLAVASVVCAQSPASWSFLGPERTFPADSGMINVKTAYGAVGDGKTDDTAAIQKAISSNIRSQNTSRVLYFPQGTYLISKPLVWKDLNGVWQSELTFQGENENRTIIKLANQLPAYQNPQAPADVITTASLSASSDGGSYNAFDN